MDLIAHWLKNEPSLQKELHEAMLAMGQQLNETPEAEQWPLRQWQSWLEENSFDLQLLQQALQQLFANAGETEPYAAIHQELSQQPGDGPGIERLLGCAEQHSEKLVPELMEQLEAEAKASEELLQTSGGSSSSHHKGFQYMSNHRAGLSAGGATVGAVALVGLGAWAYQTHTAKTRLLRTMKDAESLRHHDNDEFAEANEAYTEANEALKSWMPGKIQKAANKLSNLNNKEDTYEDELTDKDTNYQVTGRVRNTEELKILQDAGANEPKTNGLAYTRTRPASKLLINRMATSSSELDGLEGRISKKEQFISQRFSDSVDEHMHNIAEETEQSAARAETSMENEIRISENME